jgi:membrane-associated phospholipid phosphatase
VALLALLLAWRHLRWFFWVQLPFAVGLILGTVYLRHHWVVDILAGFVLTFVALWWAPRLEAWWLRMAARYSRGAEALGLERVLERRAVGS